MDIVARNKLKERQEKLKVETERWKELSETERARLMAETEELKQSAEALLCPAPPPPIPPPPIAYELTKEYVRAVARGYIDALILVSEGGLGKSWITVKTLAEEGLAEGKDYAVLTTFSTPLQLYHKIYEHRDKLLVLDDVEGIVSNRTALSIVKSALWSATPRRIVQYNSTTEKLKAPESFEFTGRMILCMNELPNNAVARALRSRAVYYEIRLPHERVVELMREIADSRKDGPLTEGERREVADYIARTSTPATNLDLRTVVKACGLRAFSKNNGGGWEAMVDGMLERDEELELLVELAGSGGTVGEQARRWTNITGRSRATFFRRKSGLGLKVSKSQMV